MTAPASPPKPVNPLAAKRLLEAAGVTPEIFDAVVKSGLAAADLDRLAQRNDFRLWLGAVSPPPWNWDWPHLAYTRAALDRVTRGECKRLAIFEPPQHGKSSLGTVRYAAWRLEREPGLRVIVACYDQKHAKKFSRQIRKIVRSRKVPLSKERQAVEEWETKAGGFLKAVGVGSGVAGTPCDLLLIDDPIRGREEAESAAYRERVWGWMTEDLFTRLQKDAAVALTQTRWHGDDPAGRLLDGPDAPNWQVVCLRAEAEEDDPLGRPLGAPLCPDRFDTPQLEERKRTLGLGYYALYQQRPVPRGGAMFRREWFDAAWAGPWQVPAMQTQVRHWDLAATADGDRTAGAKVGRGGDGLFYVLDVRRGRWTPAERDRVIRATAEADGPDVLITINKDPGQAGVSQIAALVGMLAGFRAEGVRETGSKETRAGPFASQLQAGNVRIVRGDWAREFEREFLSFPHGKYDDQVDAVSGGFNKLAKAESKYEREGMVLV